MVTIKLYNIKFSFTTKIEQSRLCKYYVKGSCSIDNRMCGLHGIGIYCADYKIIGVKKDDKGRLDSGTGVMRVMVSNHSVNIKEDVMLNEKV